jgi:hypothetical protein
VQNLTKLPGVRDSGDVRPGMAYYTGSGPPGATCGDCRFRGYWANSDRKSRGCEKFYLLSGRHGPAVKMAWMACKYFEKGET